MQESSCSAGVDRDVHGEERRSAGFGLSLTRARFSGMREARDIHVVAPVVALAVRGRGLRRLTTARRYVEAPVSPGVFGVCGEGCEIRSALYEGTPGELITLAFPQDGIERLVRDGGDAFRWRTEFAASDARVAWLVESLWSGAAGDASNPLYVEGLMLALVSLLKDSFGPAATWRQPGTFSDAIRQRIVDFIEQALGDALSVETLAREAGLSPQHFSRMFSRTFGQPPHAYVMARRIAAARRALVSASEPSVCEVASSLGFSSHAHFTKCFKAFVGVTPTQWRLQ